MIIKKFTAQAFTRPLESNTGDNTADFLVSLDVQIRNELVNKSCNVQHLIVHVFHVNQKLTWPTVIGNHL